MVDPRRLTFDVICAGEARLDVDDAAAISCAPPRLRLRAGGGAIRAALGVAAQDVRVGLATVLEDDATCRALLADVGAHCVDVGGVQLAVRTTGLLLVRGGARQAVAVGAELTPMGVPEGWSSRVLLLSGMSPSVAHGAALCKAARAARRAGTVVFVDVDVRWDIWRGRDARMLRTLLREADVVWCTAQDLVDLGMDLATLRTALRPDAALVFSDGVRSVSATGRFGDVARPLRARPPGSLFVERGVYTSVIGAVLARGQQGAEGAADLWARALQRADVVIADAAR